MIKCPTTGHAISTGIEADRDVLCPHVLCDLPIHTEWFAGECGLTSQAWKHDVDFGDLTVLLRVEDAAAERTVSGLWRRIRSILRAVSEKECLTFFRHAGYD
jgi:hypothetical protein